MKRTVMIGQIVGSLKPKEGDEGTSFTFVAQDWRKRGGAINITLDPLTEEIITNLNDILDPLEASITGDPPYLSVNSKGEFKDVIARILAKIAPCWECSIKTLDITDCSHVQYLEANGVLTPYEKTVADEMRATIIEDEIRPCILVFAQAAQRLEFLARTAREYLKADNFGGLEVYAPDPTDTPIYLLTRELPKHNPFIPEADQIAFQHEALGMEEGHDGDRLTLMRFATEWENGRLTEKTLYETYRVFGFLIGWICRRYKIDTYKYHTNRTDHLYLATNTLTEQSQ